MVPLKERDKPIVQKLLSAGCCARCILRFCCVNVQAAYRQPLQETLKELQALVSQTNTPAESSAEQTSHDASGPEAPDDPPSKRVKLEPTDEEYHVCVLCLGILQDLCDRTQAVRIAETVKKENYEFDTLVLSVSLPAQLCVREHSCWLHVKQDVRQKSSVLGKDDVVQVKEAFKWVMQGLVAKELGGAAVVTKVLKADGLTRQLLAPERMGLPSAVGAAGAALQTLYRTDEKGAETEGEGLDLQSVFEVGVEFTHPDSDADCHFLATTCPDCFRPTKNKQSMFTRMAVVKALEQISDTQFLQHSPCPPLPPASSCTPQDVQCLHASVFVAGRYNKFCRSLPQTPWLIDGERKMESSVEELIAAPILSSFRADGFNFSSSGREDVDVRTLGNGRPFAMELVNPHRSRLSREQMKQLQEAVNTSSDKIRVRDLQIVSRDAMSRMKEGEEEKTKSYTALVWTQKPIQRDDITFIDSIKDLTLDQKTPLRVLHRRALAVRQRIVHTMSTHFLDSHHFQLGLKTQAGTYIKEFVHGDFGRTKPNLCELLGTDTDILELDVESVDVDWPPVIPE